MSERWSQVSWKSFDASEKSFDPDQCEEEYADTKAEGSEHRRFSYRSNAKRSNHDGEAISENIQDEQSLDPDHYDYKGEQHVATAGSAGVHSRCRPKAPANGPKFASDIQIETSG